MEEVVQGHGLRKSLLSCQPSRNIGSFQSTVVLSEELQPGILLVQVDNTTSFLSEPDWRTGPIHSNSLLERSVYGAWRGL